MRSFKDASGDAFESRRRKETDSLGESDDASDNKPKSKPGIIALILGTILPASFLYFETSTHSIAKIALDPFPSLLLILLFSLIPLTNFGVWLAARCDVSRYYSVLALGSGMALGVGILYSLLLLPAMPMFLSNLFGCGVLGLAPLLSLPISLHSGNAICRLSDIHKAYADANQLKHVGHLIILVMVLALELPSTLTRIHLSEATGQTSSEYYGCAGSSIDTQAQQKAITWLREWGDKEVLLRACYERSGRATDIIGSIYEHQHPISVEQARNVFYRVTGVPFNSVPIPSSFRSTIQHAGLIADPAGLNDGAVDEFDLDPDIAGEMVSGVARGLSASKSTIKGTIDADAAFASLDWKFTFDNVSTVPREARSKIILPPGSVVTKATLWLDDTMRETTIMPRAQARNTYQQSVVNHKRDPLLISMSGKDTVLVQCYPVVKGTKTSIELHILSPLSISADKSEPARLTLPTFDERNFALTVPHQIDITSMSPLSVPSISLESKSQNGQNALVTSIDNAMFSRFGAVIDAKRDVTRSLVHSDNPFSRFKNVFSQARIIPISYPKPARLTVLVDQSAAMDSYRQEIAAGLRFIPEDTVVSIVSVLDGNHLLVSDKSPKDKEFKDALETLMETPCQGGQENSQALTTIMGFSNLPASESVLWIHGAQPICNEGYSLSAALRMNRSLPLLYDLAVASGPNAALQDSQFMPGVVRVERSGKLTADLRNLFASWSNERSATSSATPASWLGDGMFLNTNQSNITSNYKTTPELSQLLANRAVMLEIKAGNQQGAYEIAKAYHLVTPVSSAVVTEEVPVAQPRKCRSRADAPASVDELSSESECNIAKDKEEFSEAPSDDERDSLAGNEGLLKNNSIAFGNPFAAPQEQEMACKKADLECKMSAKGKVVYAISDVPENSVIPAEALEEKEVECSRIPQDALTSASLAAGRICKYPIEVGQIVSQHDLRPQGGKAMDRHYVQMPIERPIKKIEDRFGKGISRDRLTELRKERSQKSMMILAVGCALGLSAFALAFAVLTIRRRTRG